MVWLEFLAVLGRRWDEATAVDVEAFKHWRLTDLGNDDRIAPSSFDTDRAALSSFYRWASGRYGVLNPVPTVPARPGQRPHGSDAGLERARGTRGEAGRWRPAARGGPLGWLIWRLTRFRSAGKRGADQRRGAAAETLVRPRSSGRMHRCGSRIRH